MRVNPRALTRRSEPEMRSPRARARKRPGWVDGDTGSDQPALRSRHRVARQHRACRGPPALGHEAGAAHPAIHDPVGGHARDPCVTDLSTNSRRAGDVTRFFSSKGQVAPNEVGMALISQSHPWETATVRFLFARSSCRVFLCVSGSCVLAKPVAVLGTSAVRSVELELSTPC